MRVAVAIMTFKDGSHLIKKHNDNKATKHQCFDEVYDTQRCLEPANRAGAQIVSARNEAGDEQDAGVDATERGVEQKQ